MNEPENIQAEEPKKDVLIQPEEPKRDTRFQPGVSGNPSGRPKRTQEEKDALEAIKALAPDAVDRLKKLLESGKVTPAVKVRICELILDRTYGKAETAVKVTSTAQTVHESQAYILSLISQVRAEDGLDGENPSGKLQGEKTDVERAKDVSDPAALEDAGT